MFFRDFLFGFYAKILGFCAKVFGLYVKVLGFYAKMFAILNNTTFFTKKQFFKREDIFMKYKKIENDLFGIVGRLKLIDRNYFVLKNIFSNNFELHNKAQKGGSLCFVIGRRLNCGVLTRTRKSLRKNAKKIFGEMQRNNLRLDKKNEENTRNAYSFELKSMVDYANRKGGDVDFCGVCKTKWI